MSRVTIVPGLTPVRSLILILGNGNLFIFEAAAGLDDSFGQVVGTVGFGQHIFDGDHFVLPVIEQCVVHQLHAELGTGLHRTVDTERFVFANQVGDAGRDDQHFVGRHAAAADFWQQRLCDHADQRAGKLGSDLVLQVAGEGVDDSVDGALSTVGVQRAEHDVARFPPR